MGEWIKYDGNNRPDDNARVIVRFYCGEESVVPKEARTWDWFSDVDFDEYHDFCISHFMLKETDQ